MIQSPITHMWMNLLTCICWESQQLVGELWKRVPWFFSTIPPPKGRLQCMTSRMFTRIIRITWPGIRKYIHTYCAWIEEKRGNCGKESRDSFPQFPHQDERPAKWRIECNVVSSWTDTHSWKWLGTLLKKWFDFRTDSFALLVTLVWFYSSLFVVISFYIFFSSS